MNQHFCTEKGFKLQSTTRLLVTPSLNVYLLLLSFHLLMQSGDIESNPGPTGEWWTCMLNVIRLQQKRPVVIQADVQGCVEAALVEM